MTHYEIAYDTKQPRHLVDAQACKDAFDYLGAHNYRVLSAALIADQMRSRQFRMICAFRLGLEGYPVGAMLRRYHARYQRRFGNRYVGGL